MASSAAATAGPPRVWSSGRPCSSTCVEPLADRALPLAERALPLLDRALPLVERVAPVVDKALPLVDQAWPALQRLAPLAGQALPLLERALPALRQVAPIADQALPVVRRLVDSVGTHEVDAAVGLVDRLPELLRRLEGDVLPMLRQLDHVGPDVHSLLDTVQDLRLMVEGLPGMGFVAAPGRGARGRSEAEQRAGRPARSRHRRPAAPGPSAAGDRQASGAASPRSSAREG